MISVQRYVPDPFFLPGCEIGIPVRKPLTPVICDPDCAIPEQDIVIIT